jgi:hypothetical protein
VNTAGGQVLATFTFPDLGLASVQNRVCPERPLAADGGIRLGSVGSDLWHGRDDPPDEFWMVTDRGPNALVDAPGKDDGDPKRRTFSVPDFVPLILHVRAGQGELAVLDTIPLRGKSGRPLSGLPNIKGIDEIPYDRSAKHQLPYDPSGLDPEGLVRTRAGDFWLADDYRPSIVHVDAGGCVVRRYVPLGHVPAGADYPVAGVLPPIYANRAHNHGFEGLGISPDERTLYAALQSPLDDPDGKCHRPSRAGRILVFDVGSERPVAEYAYPFDDVAEFDPKHKKDLKQDDLGLAGVVGLTPTTLLALERTDTAARLYLLDLTPATDILGTVWDDPAQLLPKRVPDELDAGIAPVGKTLLVDLGRLKGVPRKLEGVAVVDHQTIAVANDNDFDLDKKGRKSQIVLIRTGSLPGFVPS